MRKQKYYLAAGALLCAGAIGLALPSQDTYADDGESAEAAAITEVITGAKAVVQPILDTANADLESPIEFEDLAPEYISGIVYKPSDLNAAVRLNEESGFYLHSESTDDLSITYAEVEAAISEYLTDNGFTAYPFKTIYPNMPEYLNQETGVICRAVSSLLGCSHISWLEVSDTWAQFINSIGAAYYAKEAAYPKLAYAPEVYAGEELPEAINSTFEPYQYIAVSMDDHAGLFYRTDPEADWVYYIGTQGLIACANFTGELEKAFGGMNCYDADVEGGVSTVGAQKEVATIDSGIKAPNTGDYTSEGGVIAGTSAVAIAAVGIAIYLARYAKLHSERVHSGKK